MLQADGLAELAPDSAGARLCRCIEDDPPAFAAAFAQMFRVIQEGAPQEMHVDHSLVQFNRTEWLRVGWQAVMQQFKANIGIHPNAWVKLIGEYTAPITA